MIRHVDLILDQLNDINKKSFLFLQNTDFNGFLRNVTLNVPFFDPTGTFLMRLEWKIELFPLQNDITITLLCLIVGSSFY